MPVSAPSEIRPGRVFVVSVEPGEVRVASGKVYPNATWIGTFDIVSGKLNVWTPVGYVPRGWKDAARAILENELAKAREVQP